MSEELVQGTSFDGVPNFGACSVSFNIACLARVDTSALVYRLHESLLGFTGRNADSRRMAILIHSSVGYNSTNGITGGDGIIQPFKHDTANAFTSAVTRLSSMIKREALAAIGE